MRALQGHARSDIAAKATCEVRRKALSDLIFGSKGRIGRGRVDPGLITNAEIFALSQRPLVVCGQAAHFHECGRAALHDKRAVFG